MVGSRGMLVCVAALATVLVGTAGARAESAEVAKCMEAVDMAAFKNTQMNACYEQEVARQDKVLNAEYKRPAPHPRLPRRWS